MQEIPDANGKFQHQLAGLGLSGCAKFQVDGCYSQGVMVPDVILYLLLLSDPKSIGIWPDLRHMSVSRFKLMTPTHLFYPPNTNLNLGDLSNLGNRGHYPGLSRNMGKLYIKLIIS